MESPQLKSAYLGFRMGNEKPAVMLKTVAGQDLSPFASGIGETDSHSFVHLLNNVIGKYCCIYED